MAINKVCLSGNLCREVVLEGEDNSRRVKNSLAVQRYYDKEKKEAVTDFIPVTAWRGVADYLAKNASKGSRIMLEGRIQSNTTGEGDERRTYISVTIDNVDIVGNRSTEENVPENQETEGKTTTDAGDGFVDIPDNIDDSGLPF